MRKGPRGTYERRNTDIPIKINLVMVATVKLSEWLLRFSWTIRNKYISMSCFYFYHVGGGLGWLNGFDSWII